MTKTYVLFKCGGAGRTALAIFSAADYAEAREAPTWLHRKHPDRPGLVLGPGEFFEVVERGQCPDEEWDAAVAAIGSDAPSERPA